MLERIETPTVYLPGHDQGEPRPETSGSVGHDMPAILTRACMTVDDKRFFNWKGSRYDAWKMPPTPKEPRLDFDNIVQWLGSVRPGEVESIKRLSEFPFRHLHLKIHPGETILVPLGIKAAVREDKVCYLYPRASAAKKRYVLANDVGVIDPDYPDEWFAAVMNVGEEVLLIQHGQRIVQAVFGPRIVSTFPGCDKLPSRGDRTGGFGSTDSAGVMESQNGPDHPDGPESEGFEPGFESRSGYDEPPPDNPVARAVRDMVDEATPEEDEALDQALQAEDDSVPIQLICGNVMVGPVAKWRPTTHKELSQSSGTEAVVNMLLREFRHLGPKAFQKMTEALLSQSVGPTEQDS